MFIEVTSANSFTNGVPEEAYNIKILLRRDRIVRLYKYGEGTRIQSDIAGEIFHQDAQESYEDICLKLGVKSGN